MIKITVELCPFSNEHPDVKKTISEIRIYNEELESQNSIFVYKYYGHVINMDKKIFNFSGSFWHNKRDNVLFLLMKMLRDYLNFDSNNSGN